ncbi:MAG: L,D-transpeptidase [Candidatus Riflebacteria bacterium]|nr:L,D-transpeptidase [Candidatus Riflebacteria bacterium]
MRLATAHLADFTERLGEFVKAEATFLLVDKSAFLVYLMELKTNRALAAFPIAYGVNSNEGPKTRRGDLRTPESPAGERDPGSTPFYAHPTVEDDPFPSAGCITRGIGVSSDDPRFSFLSGGWTVMLHGTPDRGCIGTRASHGCIRLLPEHIKVLFDHIRDGTKIIIVP